MFEAASEIPAILKPYYRSLQSHIEIVETLRPHHVKFEKSRESIAAWIAQPALEESSWEAHWEDLCQVEIDRWDSSK